MLGDRTFNLIVCDHDCTEPVDAKRTTVAGRSICRLLITWGVGALMKMDAGKEKMSSRRKGAGWRNLTQGRYPTESVACFMPGTLDIAPYSRRKWKPGTGFINPTSHSGRLADHSKGSHTWWQREGVGHPVGHIHNDYQHISLPKNTETPLLARG